MKKVAPGIVSGARNGVRRNGVKEEWCQEPFAPSKSQFRTALQSVGRSSSRITRRKVSSSVGFCPLSM
jgi:hypothetical protein